MPRPKRSSPGGYAFTSSAAGMHAPLPASPFPPALHFVGDNASIRWHPHEEITRNRCRFLDEYLAQVYDWATAGSFYALAVNR